MRLFGHGLLNGQSAFHCTKHPSELSEDAVASRVDNAAPVLGGRVFFPGQRI
jgi:hypothetical protein